MIKKLLFTAIFVVGVTIIPGIILLLTVNAQTDFHIYIFVYGIILFFIFGYIIISIHALSKQLSQAMDDLKKQNAAIAHVLLGNHSGTEEADEKPEEEAPKDTSRVVLNPADPLPAVESKGNDSFDDFE
jgi:hypothetical protein